MQRRSLPEIDDQPWLPRSVRDAFTDYLRFMTTVARPYRAAVGLLADALVRSGATSVVDLASGGGGPWLQLRPELARRGVEVEVVLTDRYPNLDAARELRSVPGIDYLEDEIDARNPPSGLRGFRTVFSSFHHFEPADAQAILRDASAHGAGIAVFEAVQRTPTALAAALFVPLPLVLVAPFIRPFRWSRLLWTYLLPLAPMVLVWDALASVRKAYTAQELLALARSARADWDWRAGVVEGARLSLPITYLIGTPPEPARERR